MKLLVSKGADVHAKACGKFFQPHDGPYFYFGESMLLQRGGIPPLEPHTQIIWEVSCESLGASLLLSLLGCSSTVFQTVWVVGFLLMTCLFSAFFVTVSCKWTFSLYLIS